MLAGVAEAEPPWIWFGRGGCVEQHDDGTHAVFVRGELLGVYMADDVASRVVFIAVVRARDSSLAVGASAICPTSFAPAGATATGASMRHGAPACSGVWSLP